MKLATRIAAGIGIFATAVSAVIGGLDLWKRLTEPHGSLVARVIPNVYEVLPIDPTRPGAPPEIAEAEVKKILEAAGVARIPDEKALRSIASDVNLPRALAAAEVRSRLYGGFYQVSIENSGNQVATAVRLRIQGVQAWCVQRESQARKCAFTGSPMDLGDIAPADRLGLSVWTNAPPATFDLSAIRISHAQGLGTVDLGTVELPPSRLAFYASIAVALIVFVAASGFVGLVVDFFGRSEKSAVEEPTAAPQD